MSGKLFRRLARDNMRKNSKLYVPYLITCTVSVAMYYIIKSLSVNPGLDDMYGAAAVKSTMELGTGVVAFFSVIFLFYTNSFLIKRRKKEFGVFNILGMEKKHLAKVMVWETLNTAVISLAAGLAVGIALDKAVFLLVRKIIGGGAELGFFVSSEALAATVMIFAAVFMLILINNIRQVRKADPAELLSASNAGEKEPKTRWLMALLGVACIGTGYGMSITIENPVASLTFFFVAVLLVIAGTYLVITAGSIAMLKILKKNKGYYYKTKHFVSVSGMIYRMKRNGAGLANICVLSTMVLVMISSTAALVAGMEHAIQERYPEDFAVECAVGQETEVTDKVKAVCREENMPVDEAYQNTYLAFAAIRSDDGYRVKKAAADANDMVAAVKDLAVLCIIMEDDFNAIEGKDLHLADDEVFIYSPDGEYKESTVDLIGREYSVVAPAGMDPGKYRKIRSVPSGGADRYYIIVPSMADMQRLYAIQADVYGDNASDIQFRYAFDTTAGTEEQRSFLAALTNSMEDVEGTVSIDSRIDGRDSFIALYGSLLFIGVYLGLLFSIVTVLIMYYKQMSEGYEDREKFRTMRNVGMTETEVKSTIRSQVLTVFFIPPVMAGIHLAASTPMIHKILTLINMNDLRIFITSIAICYLAFVVLYIMSYIITSKSYYRITSDR